MFFLAFYRGRFSGIMFRTSVAIWLYIARCPEDAQRIPKHFNRVESNDTYNFH